MQNFPKKMKIQNFLRPVYSDRSLHNSNHNTLVQNRFGLHQWEKSILPVSGWKVIYFVHYTFHCWPLAYTQKKDVHLFKRIFLSSMRTPVQFFPLKHDACILGWLKMWTAPWVDPLSCFFLYMDPKWEIDPTREVNFSKSYQFWGTLMHFYCILM